MDEVAKGSVEDDNNSASSLAKLMSSTLEHWESESLTPEMTINFDEPVTILDVVLKPSYYIVKAESEYTPNDSPPPTGGGASSTNPNPNTNSTTNPNSKSSLDETFNNLVLSEGERIRPKEMEPSFDNIK